MIRITAADQLFYIVTKCNTDIAIVESFISLLFSTIEVIHICRLTLNAICCYPHAECC